MLGTPFDPATPTIEPITSVAVMSAVTETLRFMTYAYVMRMHDPFPVAKESRSIS
ncbi:MAG: alkanesulfonate monooxygenase SsuD [Zhongshania sp.]|jgi:alkanesulfonate monooxygenase SsuD/methylene tetrahydromethanopterin reductase-like flavin-dependent oxidoreductase (luciferase family)